MPKSLTWKDRTIGTHISAHRSTILDFAFDSSLGLPEIADPTTWAPIAPSLIGHA